MKSSWSIQAADPMGTKILWTIIEIDWPNRTDNQMAKNENNISQNGHNKNNNIFSIALENNTDIVFTASICGVKLTFFRNLHAI